MYQLTYQLRRIDDFVHKITQDGASFIFRGPETETYFKTPKHQLRLEEGNHSQLLLIKSEESYQEIVDVQFDNPKDIRSLLMQLHGERLHLSKLVIRYLYKQTLIEIHRHKRIGDLLYIQGEEVHTIKEIARELGLEDRFRMTFTSADLEEQI